MKNKEYLLLTSEKNFSWFSMTEIIPGIKTLWEKYCVKNNITLNIINVDNTDVKELLTTSLNIDHIVITCFNMKISWALKLIRTKFGVDAPFSLYVHGMATTGMWPLSHWEWDKTLKEKDTFVVNCKKDFDLLTNKFPRINVDTIPFISSLDIQVDESISDGPLAFYYAGRISEQKNLHTLIFSYYLFCKDNEDSTLNIFGEEDFLGSPNMNIESREYKKYLQALVKDLGLESRVKFHGFVPREDISSILGCGNKIFISTSLHSDENFGMAVLHAINSGHRVILSDWGGYSDFKDSYPQSVKLISVKDSLRGPCININEILDTMNSYEELVSKSAEDKYSVDNVQALLANIFNKNHKRVADFSFARDLSSKRKSLCDKDNSSWLFKNYSDSSYLDIASYYSSTAQKDAKEIDFDRVKIVPWVEIKDDSLLLDDPHKGLEEIILGSDRKIVIDGFQLNEESVNFLNQNELLYYEVSSK